MLIDVGDGAAAKIDALEKAAGSMRPIYETVGNVLLNRVRLCFKLGIDPWGTPWQRIKWRAPSVQQVTGKYGGYRDKINKDGSLAYTAKGKKQLAANAAASAGTGSAGKPLVDTGALRNSITSRADDEGVTVGTNLRQARLHQFGGTIVPKKAKMLAFPGPNGMILFAKRVTIPARPYMPLRRGAQIVELPPSWSLLVAKAFKQHLSEAVEA